MTSRRPLVVFSDDWGRHPSSCQHLVRLLLDDCDVTWINTIGTRPVRVDLTTIRRGWEKLRQWGTKRRQPAHVGRSPRVVNPVMWPGFHSGWQRTLNRRLLGHVLRTIPRLEEATILTTLPIVADLVGTVPAARWVYYCVDDFSQWPGLDGKTLEQMEHQLIDRVDAIVSAGENLAERIRRRGRESAIVSHGVDLEHWSNAQVAETLPDCLQSPDKPVALFWGLVDRRLDIAWVKALAESLEIGSLVFVGPQQDPDPALAGLARVRLAGPLPFAQLPAAARAADVLIMPYGDLPVTRAMQPLKLKEYLATGKPVIVRSLPSTETWADCLDAVQTAHEFVGRVVRRCRKGLPAEQRAARGRLREEGWSAKARALEALLFSDCANSLASVQ